MLANRRPDRRRQRGGRRCGAPAALPSRHRPAALLLLPALLLSAVARCGVAANGTLPLYVAPLGVVRDNRNGTATPDGYVEKTVWSNHKRAVFVAGLGGVGHHGIADVFKTAGVFTGLPTTLLYQEKEFWHLDRKNAVEASLREQYTKWFAQHEPAVAGAEDDGSPLMVNLNCYAGVMAYYSYPGRSDYLHHPNVVWLTRLVQSLGVDVRILLVMRDPVAQLISTSYHRHMDGGPANVSAHAQLQVNQLDAVFTQFSALDPKFFMCAEYEHLREDAEVVSAFFLGNITWSGERQRDGRTQPAAKLQRAMERVLRPSKRDTAAQAMTNYSRDANLRGANYGLRHMYEQINMIMERLCPNRT